MNNNMCNICMFELVNDNECHCDLMNEDLATSINRNFREDMIDDMDMGQPNY